MKILRYLAGLVAGLLVAGIIAFVLIMNARPDLSIWHTVDLDEEFSTDTELETFAEYLALENRLFNQLDREVYAEVPTGSDQAINRYSRGSLADPSGLQPDWNRSFELAATQPRAGVLLLHGLSDSPYSMRALAQSLHRQGATVLGLRLPGHGTAPAGLVDVRWQDMAAAVRLAADHLQSEVGAQPIYLVGYSNGGALAVDYVLDALSDSALPRISGVVLLAPEIGVARSAAFAVWQGRLGHALGMDKLAWVSITPEYDPYKYGSFAVNAGDLAYRITAHLQKQITRLQKGDRLGELPPILAFQSGVDSTVTAAALIDNLFARLPAAGHELVLFDINRHADMGSFIKHDPSGVFAPLLKNAQREYDLTVISNGQDTHGKVHAMSVAAGSTRIRSRLLPDWPRGIYSLSHVALPFPPDDPWYGGDAAADGHALQLGNLALRGERGVLRISAADMLRLRWNPFFDYVESRVLGFTDLDAANEAAVH